jgi:pimeloyl-ACP methyl ester carboxylesterase
MRYFGKEPWSDKWPAFSSQLHTSDLAPFLRELKAGPAHLVTWSYSGHIALSVALDHPELVKSVFAFEPGVPSYVTDPAALKTIQDSAGTMFGPVVEALKQGDEAESTRRLINGVAGVGPDFFRQLPKELQALLLDNARTMPPLFNEPPAREISCSQLAAIKVPVAIAWGDQTTPFFRIIGETAASCVQSAKHIVVPGAGHMWPGEDPAGFTSTLVGFLKARTAAR